jgi:hypothetical protein
MRANTTDRRLAQSDLTAIDCRLGDYRPPTKSQRLRFVLYRLWERSGSEQSFEEWYADRMDRIIGRIESLLA